MRHPIPLSFPPQPGSSSHPHRTAGRDHQCARHRHEELGWLATPHCIRTMLAGSSVPMNKISSRGSSGVEEDKASGPVWRRWWSWPPAVRGGASTRPYGRRMLECTRRNADVKPLTARAVSAIGTRRSRTGNEEADRGLYTSSSAISDNTDGSLQRRPWSRPPIHHGLLILREVPRGIKYEKDDMWDLHVTEVEEALLQAFLVRMKLL